MQSRNSRSDIPWFKGGSTFIDAPGYDFELGSGNWHAVLSDNNNHHKVECAFPSSMDLAHLVAVVDRMRGNLLVYVNGSLASTCPLGALGSTNSNSEARIGARVVPFNGTLDEVRVYSEAITSDRVALEYYNVTAPDHLLSVGDEQPGGYPL